MVPRSYRKKDHRHQNIPLIGGLFLLVSSLCASAQGFGVVAQPIFANATSSGPQMAPNPFYWFRADSIGIADGAVVGTWINEGSQAINVFSSGGINVFYTNNVANGHAGVYFPGNGFMPSHGLANQYVQRATQPLTLFVVCRRAATGNMVIYDAWINSLNQEVAIYTSTATTSPSLFGGAGLEAPTALAPTNVVISAVLNGASSYVRTNGVLAVSGNGGSNNLGDPTIGSNIVGISGPLFTGYVFECVTYISALSTNDLQSTEQFLMQKYGIP